MTDWSKPSSQTLTQRCGDGVQQNLYRLLWTCSGVDYCSAEAGSDHRLYSVVSTAINESFLSAQQQQTGSAQGPPRPARLSWSSLISSSFKQPTMMWGCDVNLLIRLHWWHHSRHNNAQKWGITSQYKLADDGKMDTHTLSTFQLLE